MAQTNIESKMIVNPFASHENEGKRSQDIEQSAYKEDPLVMKAFKQYSPERYSYTDLPVLTPQQVDAVLQRIVAHHETCDTENKATAIYLNGLIRASYLSFDHRDFTCSTGSHYIMLCNVEEFAGYPMNARVVRNAGEGSFQFLKNSRVIVEGDAADGLCEYQTSSKTIVGGNVSDYCAALGHYLDVTIHGNAGKGLGTSAYGCKFTVYGDIGEDVLAYAEECQLRTPRRETFEKVLSYAKKGVSNIITLIDDKRTEVMKRQL